MRTDKKKNISKVAKELLNNPLLTEREIAENTWLWNWTIHRAKEELEQIGAKDPKIIHITDKDLENIVNMQAVISEKIKDKSEMSKTRIWELAQAMREATARYTIFRGNWTDDQWWAKNITVVEIL